MTEVVNEQIAAPMLVRSASFPGTLAHWSALMERLHSQHGGLWTSTTGIQLQFNEYRNIDPILALYGDPPQIVDRTPPSRACWEVCVYVPVVNCRREASPGYARIDAYEQPDHTVVDFWDGRRPWNDKEHRPQVGPAFTEFCEVVIRAMQPALPVGPRKNRVVRPTATKEKNRAEEEIHLPNRPDDLRRWKAIWGAVKDKVRQGAGRKTICDWLHTTHLTGLKGCKLTCSPDTLRKIIRAGEAGLLDD